MRLKTVEIDGATYAETRDGMPIYLADDGAETALDAPALAARARHLEGAASIAYGNGVAMATAQARARAAAAEAPRPATRKWSGPITRAAFDGLAPSDRRACALAAGRGECQLVD